jgi:hypothetical protein
MERLTVSLPQVPPAEVQRVVHLFYVQFIGNPIRDFVPVLLERMARDDLRAKLTGYRCPERPLTPKQRPVDIDNRTSDRATPVSGHARPGAAGGV